MRPTSIQIKSVMDAYGEQGWQYEHLEGQDVLRTVFQAYHVSVHLHAQAFAQLNALSIVGEVAFDLSTEHEHYLLELLTRANKKIILGALEYDLERSQLVFRTSNLFEKEKYDANIVSSMTHTVIAELDRIFPYAEVIQQTDEQMLEDLDLEELLERDDLIPPVPTQEYTEN